MNYIKNKNYLEYKKIKILKFQNKKIKEWIIQKLKV